jgi:hypothetical protein
VRLQSVPTPQRESVRPRNLSKLSRPCDRCQPFEITGFPHLISTVGEFVSRKATFKLENSLQRARKRAPARNGHEFRRTPTRKTMKTLKIAGRLCFSRKPFRDLVPECEPQEAGLNRGLAQLDAKSPPRRFSGQAKTHSHCPRFLIFIPELPGVRKRGAKKVTCGEDTRRSWLAFRGRSHGNAEDRCLIRLPFSTDSARLAGSARLRSARRWRAGSRH